MLVTDFERSFAVFTYYCGDIGFPNSAFIGFQINDGFIAVHETTANGNTQSIACSNTPDSPWVNVVYGISSSGRSKCIQSLSY